jgi:hypothetical protein
LAKIIGRYCLKQAFTFKIDFFGNIFSIEKKQLCKRLSCQTKFMKQIQISGRMTVRTLKQDILETFGLFVQVIHQAELAKDTDTLVTISLKRGNISTEKLIVRANTLVENFREVIS